MTAMDMAPMGTMRRENGQKRAVQMTGYPRTIDVEAPPPRDVISEDTTKQGTHDLDASPHDEHRDSGAGQGVDPYRGKSKDTAKCTHESRALLERANLGDNREAGSENSSSANTGEGTTEDEDVHAGSDGTDEGAQFEYRNGD